jgi:hypothetical protein
MGFKLYKKHRSFHDESRDIYYVFIVSFVGMKSVKSIKTFEVLTIHKSGRYDYERVHCPQKVCRIKWKVYGRQIMFDWNEMGRDI